MKSRTLRKFGFSMSTPTKTRSSAFHWNNSRTSKSEGILSSDKQNSFTFRSSGSNSMISRTLGKFGFSMSTATKTRSSAFHWNNSRTSKIEGILSSEKSCESSVFSMSSGIISTPPIGTTRNCVNPWKRPKRSMSTLKS